MSDHPTGSISPIAQLVELHEQLQSDSNANERALHQRDRAIAIKDDFLKSDRRSQVLAWLNKVREPAIGYKADSALRLIRLALIVIGGIVGIVTVGGLFHYTGKQPVNVVHVLAVFVGFQLLLLLLGIVMSLSAGRDVFDSLSLLSPGRWAMLILQRFDQPVRDSFEQAVGTAKRHTRVFGAVHKWLIIDSAQLFAVAFNFAAITTAICLVVFTDLAFGWGTTIETDGRTLHQITTALATPWATFFPDAVPTRELIDTTRIFRLQISSTGEEISNPEKFGGWWPFLIACMMLYGLLPRLITLSIAQLRLKQVVRSALLSTPGVAQLFDRLHTPLIQTQATVDEPQQSDELQTTSPSQQAASDVGAIVNWSDVALSDDRAIALCRAYFLNVGDAVFQAGGSRSLNEDKQTIDAIADQSGAAVVLVRAFEPPMGEFLDFVSDIRKAIGDGRAINVVPIEAEDDQLSVWRKRLSTLGDPWLCVRDVRPEAGV